MGEETDAAKTNDSSLTLTLERGDKGLGFNIKGGSDDPYIDGDSGIFISRIKEEGAAAKDGRLKVGDRVIKVNGTSIENVEHRVAVNTFVNAGSLVTLTVIQGNESLRRKWRGPGKAYDLTPFRIIIPMVLGIAAVGAFYLIRSRRSSI